MMAVYFITPGKLLPVIITIIFVGSSLLVSATNGRDVRSRNVSLSRVPTSSSPLVELPETSHETVRLREGQGNASHPLVVTGNEKEKMSQASTPTHSSPVTVITSTSAISLGTATVSSSSPQVERDEIPSSLPSETHITFNPPSHSDSSSLSTVVSSYWNSYVNLVKETSSLWLKKVTSAASSALSFRSLIQLNLLSLALLAASAFISFLMSPEARDLFENLPNTFSLGTGVEEMARKVELAIDSYGRIDPEVCLRMAACTLGKSRKSTREEATISVYPTSTVANPDVSIDRTSNGNPSSSLASHHSNGNNLTFHSPHNSSSLDSTLPSPPPSTHSPTRDPSSHPLFLTIQLFDKFLSLMNPGKYAKLERNYRNGRDYGWNGGDCDAFNRDHECPLDSKTWNLLLSSLASVLY